MDIGALLGLVAAPQGDKAGGGQVVNADNQLGLIANNAGGDKIDKSEFMALLSMFVENGDLSQMTDVQTGAGMGKAELIKLFKDIEKELENLCVFPDGQGQLLPGPIDLDITEAGEAPSKAPANDSAAEGEALLGGYDGLFRGDFLMSPNTFEAVGGKLEAVAKGLNAVVESFAKIDMQDELPKEIMDKLAQRIAKLESVLGAQGSSEVIGAPVSVYKSDAPARIKKLLGKLEAKLKKFKAVPNGFSPLNNGDKGHAPLRRGLGKAPAPVMESSQKGLNVNEDRQTRVLDSLNPAGDAGNKGYAYAFDADGRLEGLPVNGKADSEVSHNDAAFASVDSGHRLTWNLKAGAGAVSGGLDKHIVENVITNISDKVKEAVLLNKIPSGIRMKLNPPELGHLRIDIIQDRGGELQIKILASDRVTEHMLRENVADLKDSFSGHIKVSHVSIQLNESSGSDLRDSSYGGGSYNRRQRGQEWREVNKGPEEPSGFKELFNQIDATV